MPNIQYYLRLPCICDCGRVRRRRCCTADRSRGDHATDPRPVALRHHAAAVGRGRVSAPIATVHPVRRLCAARHHLQPGQADEDAPPQLHEADAHERSAVPIFADPPTLFRQPHPYRLECPARRNRSLSPLLTSPALSSAILDTRVGRIIELDNLSPHFSVFRCSDSALYC